MSTLEHPLLLSLLVCTSLAVAGCGKPDRPADAAPAPSVDGVRVVAITADDTMKYSLSEIRATPGEKLRINLANIGRMPKQAMAHNWVLLKPMSDSEVMAFGMAAATKPPTYLPADQAAILAHIKLLGPGEKASIEITAPTTPGEYPFVCTFPGHGALMKGKLIVN